MYVIVPPDVNAPLIVAGFLAILGAAIHGVAGELWVVRKLSPDVLPPTRFGGSRLTRTMIHVTWHMTTIAFVTVGAALLASGTFLHGDSARSIAFVAAGASTGFAALAVASSGSPRAVFAHPGPPVLTATAALAWWGAL